MPMQAANLRFSFARFHYYSLLSFVGVIVWPLAVPPTLDSLYFVVFLHISLISRRMRVYLMAVFLPPAKYSIQTEFNLSVDGGFQHKAVMQKWQPIHKHCWGGVWPKEIWFSVELFSWNKLRIALWCIFVWSAYSVLYWTTVWNPAEHQPVHGMPYMPYPYAYR